MLAELVVLAPGGVEEERGPGYVEYAIYGADGRAARPGELEAAAGDGLVEIETTEIPDDWADRWRDFHEPVLVGDRLWLRPSWEPSRATGSDRHRRRPRPGLRHRRPPDAPGCASSCCSSWPTQARRGGPLTDLGTGSGVLAIAAAKLGWEPVAGCDHEAAALEAAAANAAANGVELELRARQPARGAAAAGADRRRQPDRAAAARVAGRLGRSPAGAADLLGPARAPRRTTSSDGVSPRPACSEAERRTASDWAG